MLSHVSAFARIFTSIINPFKHLKRIKNNFTWQYSQVLCELHGPFPVGRHLSRRQVAKAEGTPLIRENLGNSFNSSRTFCSFDKSSDIKANTMSGAGDHEDEAFVVKLRGLPWSTSVDEILEFFSDCSIKNGKHGIHMTMSREGRPSGEAYVEMDADDDIERACKKDRDHMGHRYIEVFKAKRTEMDWVVKRSGLNLENAMDDGCVRLRGLPFGCSKEEIAQFFSGLEIVPNGISLPTDYTGRSTGEAYVQFVNKEVAEKALQKHKDKIGHRYIEIFRSSLAEVRAAVGPKMRPSGPGGFNQRPAPYDRGDRFGGMNRYNNMGRGSRSFKGNHTEGSESGFGDFDDGPMAPWGFNNSWGNGGGGPRGNSGPGGARVGNGGGLNLGMNSNLGRGGGRPMGGNGGNNWNSNGTGSDGMGGGHCIHMRGLPFRATQADIADFFRPAVPINIRLLYDNSGRASGEADVEFGSHDEAVKGMSKDKGHMQHRYIELFLNSTLNTGGGGIGGGNFGNMGGGNFNSGNTGGGFGGGLGGNFQRGYSNNMGGGGGGGGGMGFNSQMGGNNYSSF